jgi:hypothetical protein
MLIVVAYITYKYCNTIYYFFRYGYLATKFTYNKCKNLVKPNVQTPVPIATEELSSSRGYPVSSCDN